jgi:hypothetical protein
MLRTFLLCGALATAACGATTRDNAPVTTPTRTNDVSSTPTSGPVEVTTNQFGQIPVGTEFDVRLQTPLSSETATVEQRFEATTAADIMQNGRVLVPAGSTVRGVVSDVKRPGRVDRVGSLTLSFDELVVNGRRHAMRGMATQIFESGGIREEAGTAGAGAGVGAVVGGLLGGVKGAVLGAVIGAGGAIAATEGKDIHLPAGSIIRIRVDQAVDVR